jgi:WD40 repeat protein
MAVAQPGPGAEVQPLAGVLGRLGTPRFQNVGRVLSVAYSPDGRLLATGAWDGSLRLWQPDTARLVREWAGHDGWVKSVAFAPDGKTLASAGKDGRVRFWDVATGKEVRRLRVGSEEVRRVVFAPDGKTCATDSWDSRSRRHDIRLWDLATAKERGRFCKMEAGALCVSRGGQVLAVGRQDRSDWDRQKVRLWDVAAGKELAEVGHTRQMFSAVALSPDGKTLVSATWFEKKIRFWDVATGEEQEGLTTPGTGYTSLAFAPDGRTLAAAGGEDLIHLWELATRRECRRFRGEERGEICLAFAPDGRALATGSLDISALLWDLTGRRQGGRLAPVRLSPAELQARAADLKSADAAPAWRAVWALVAAAPQSVPLLKETVRPVPRPDPRLLTRLITDLESAQFAVRSRAEEELARLGESAGPALRKALAGSPPLEMRRRVEQLLRRLNQWTPERLRALRALAVLEQADTPEARAVLGGLARGAPGTWLTREAEKVLRRLTWRAARTD